MSLRESPGGNIRIGFVGTGFIADLHMEAIKRIKGVQVVACCDLNRWRADNFTKRWNIAKAYDDLDSFIEEQSLDVVHVLVPPDKHVSIAKRFIDKGIRVFLEKPMAPTVAECEELVAAARPKGIDVGVNHNFIFYPLFQRLKKDLASGMIGRPEYVTAFYGGPLGQLDFGKFGHWMFAEPGNVLLEQGPHPISQVMDILGDVTAVNGKASGRRELGKNQFFYGRWEALLECERGNAFVHLSFGAKHSPQRLIGVYGQDGAILVDLLNNRYLRQPKSIFPDYLDPTARAMRYFVPGLEGFKDFGEYFLGKVKLKDRSDPFFMTMKNSIAAFYQALRSNQPVPCSAENGLKVIQTCHQWIQSANLPSNPVSEVVLPAIGAGPDDEVLVTGATGFVGKAVVEKLIAQGKKVRIFVRSARGLPAALQVPQVRAVVGDMTDTEALRQAVSGVKSVIHLAHSLGSNWREFEQLNIVPADTLARACMEFGVDRFVFASTIAAFCYADLPQTSSGLGMVNPESPVDQKPQERNHYARSKIMIEERLMQMVPEGLPLVIARPGIVVGRDGILTHSGVGQWSRDNVCAFWGMGHNALPFVLVDDVADAFVAMLERDGVVGKTLNLVGDVRLSARDYIRELNAISGRRIKSFPYPTRLCFASDALKYGIKWATGDREGLLSYRDLANRSALSDFDCSAEKELLGWAPCRDPKDFVQKAIGWAFKEDGK